MRKQQSGQPPRAAGKSKRDVGLAEKKDANLYLHFNPQRKQTDTLPGAQRLSHFSLMLKACL